MQISGHIDIEFCLEVDKEQKGRDLTQSYDNLHQHKCQKGKVTTQTTPQKIDNTAIVDRLRTVSWNNYSHQTGVVCRFYRTHLPTHRNSCLIEGKNIQILLHSDIKVVYISQLKHLKDFLVKNCVARRWKIVFTFNLNVFEN